MAWFTRLTADSGFALHVLPAEIVMSLGAGFAFVALSSTALTGVDARDAGVASALVNTTQQVGGSLGVGLLNTIAASATVSYISAHGTGATAAGTVRGYTVAFTWCLGALLLAALLSLVLVAKRRADPRGDGTGETPREHTEELDSTLRPRAVGAGSSHAQGGSRSREGSVQYIRIPEQ
jgi:hypothetical protein